MQILHPQHGKEFVLVLMHCRSRRLSYGLAVLGTVAVPTGGFADVVRGCRCILVAVYWPEDRPILGRVVTLPIQLTTRLRFAGSGFSEAGTLSN